MNNKNTKSVKDLLQVIEKEEETPPRNENPTNNSNITKIKKKESTF